jgi:hypothetical protein
MLQAIFTTVINIFVNYTSASSASGGFEDTILISRSNTFMMYVITVMPSEKQKIVLAADQIFSSSFEFILVIKSR